MKLRSMFIRFAQSDVIRILVGNKCDLTEKREVTFEEGQEMAKNFGIEFLETSAKDIVNINECFMKLSKTVIDKISKGNHEKESDTSYKDLQSGRTEVKKKCCN